MPDEGSPDLNPPWDIVTSSGTSNRRAPRPPLSVRIAIEGEKINLSLRRGTEAVAEVEMPVRPVYDALFRLGGRGNDVLEGEFQEIPPEPGEGSPRRYRFPKDVIPPAADA